MATVLRAPVARQPVLAHEAAWFVAAACASFLVPYVGVSILGLQHDVYYLGYFVVVALLLAAYVRVEGVDVRRLVARHWRWSLALGVVVAAFVVLNVLRTADGTPRPHGVSFAFELLWRGAGYGVVDAALLSAFPGVVAYRILRGRTSGVRGMARYAGLALLLVLAITAAYHLGYPQYREDGVRQPETGNAIISVPTLLTVNPIGSVLAHASMHVAAVTHSYETEVFLPPTTPAP